MYQFDTKNNFMYQFFIGFLLVQCKTNPEYLLPSIKNKKTTAKKISPEFEEFVQRFWCQPEKSSDDAWDDGIKNQLKNELEVEIQKRTSKL